MPAEPPQPQDAARNGQCAAEPDDLCAADGHAPVTDPDSWAYWQDKVSQLPEMTDDEITAVALLLRRIDARRGDEPPRAA